ncbi:hypothetical protein D9M71_498350 [compost metagenome]
MKDGRPVLTAELENLLIALGFAAGAELTANQLLERPGLGQLAGVAHGGDYRFAIQFGRQVIGLHRRGLHRIGGGNAYIATAFGAQLANRHGEAGEGVHTAAGRVGTERTEVVLDVGGGALLQHPCEQSALVDTDGQWPAAGQ